MGSGCSVVKQEELVEPAQKIRPQTDSIPSMNSDAHAKRPVLQREPSRGSVFGCSVNEISGQGLRSVHNIPDLGTGPRFEELSDIHSLCFLGSNTKSADDQDAYLFFGIVDTVRGENTDLVTLTRQMLKDTVQGAIEQYGDELVSSEMAAKVMLGAIAKIKNAIENSIHVEERGITIAILHFGAPHTVTCCNVGTSKAVCIIPKVQQSKTESNPSTLALSADHSWKNKEEAARPLSMKCHIGKFTLDNVGAVGKDAVWYAEGHRKHGERAPGISTSRAIGCTSYRDAGIISDPTITVTDIREKEAIVVVASQGLWSILDEMDLVKLATTQWNCKSGVLSAQVLAELLMNEAAERWSEYYTEENVQVQCFYPSLFITLANSFLGHASLKEKKLT